MLRPFLDISLRKCIRMLFSQINYQPQFALRVCLLQRRKLTVKTHSPLWPPQSSCICISEVVLDGFVLMHLHPPSLLVCGFDPQLFTQFNLIFLYFFYFILGSFVLLFLKLFHLVPFAFADFPGLSFKHKCYFCESLE